MGDIVWLDSDQTPFPLPENALDDPNGLLAAGGDLSPKRLINAYSHGIFPWFEKDQPILWWSPEPRCLIDDEHLHISKSLRKRLNKRDYEIRIDTEFERVIRACAGRRKNSSGTWITEEMIQAYIRLNEIGVAHSFEVWIGEKLAGGLYGVSIGPCFFGESMFSHQTDTSKIAFVHLVKQLTDWGFALIDCQLENPHLGTLGAYPVSREHFLSILRKEVVKSSPISEWIFTWHW